MTRQRPEAGRPAVAEDGRVRRPCPNQRIVASEAEEGDNASRLTLHACIGKRIPVNRNFAACQHGTRRPMYVGVLVRVAARRAGSGGSRRCKIRQVVVILGLRW